MNKDTLLIGIKGLEESKEALLKEIKAFVKDKSIPLEERWELFISSKLGDFSSYYFHFESLNEDDYHANKDKYEKCDVLDVIDHFEDKEYSIEEINKFKEEVLEKFIFSWTFDW